MLGPSLKSEGGGLRQKGVRMDLAPGTGSFSDLHGGWADPHLCS